MKVKIVEIEKDFKPIKVKFTIKSKKELEDLVKAIGEMDGSYTDIYNTLEAYLRTV